jgi:putative hydrolase of the HAD superfamily
MIKAFIFDFGGVLADEGFREGLKAIGRKHGLDEDAFYHTASELVYETGYISALVDEACYWHALRERTGIAGSDDSLRDELLKRFVVRPGMISCVGHLRKAGFRTAILSDQTNWLDELEEKNNFYRHFDYVFNSFKTGKSKRDVSMFTDACKIMGVRPDETVFVDDNAENIRRASLQGMKVLHFKGEDSFEKEMEEIIESVSRKSSSEG